MEGDSDSLLHFRIMDSPKAMMANDKKITAARGQRQDHSSFNEEFATTTMISPFGEPSKNFYRQTRTRSTDVSSSGYLNGLL